MLKLQEKKQKKSLCIDSRYAIYLLDVETGNVETETMYAYL